MADGWKIAATFVGAGLDSDWLDRLAQELEGQSLDNTLTWLAATLTATDLLNQLEQSNERISILVKSVKEYSYMDQAPVQEIDVHDGLESTLTMLAHKLRQGITVTREYDRNRLISTHTAANSTRSGLTCWTTQWMPCTVRVESGYAPARQIIVSW